MPEGVAVREQDRRVKLTKQGPTHLRWALVEAAIHAARHPVYHYQATKVRLDRQRGAKVARVEVARKLTETIWHMLTKVRRALERVADPQVQVIPATASGSCSTPEHVTGTYSAPSLPAEIPEAP